MIRASHSETATTWRIVLEGGSAAPRRARHEIAAHLNGELGAERTQDAVLLVGELVTNSVFHAATGAAHEIVVELVIGLDDVRIAVTDGGSPNVPMVQPLDPTKPGGRGLFLVDTLSDRWGMTRQGTRADAGLVRDGPRPCLARRQRLISASHLREDAPMGVLAIWRYPVKAMLGELLEAVAIGPRGCQGDRRWIVVDASTGERIANKRGPTDPRLRACRAELLDDRDERPPLRITLPDDSTLVGAEIEAALSELLERRVRLERSEAPADGRFGTTGAYHDLAPVHLVTTGTLARLRAVAPGLGLGRRGAFAPTSCSTTAPRVSPFAEDALLGGRLRASSGLELTVGLPTPRCVVPTRAQDGLPADPALLRTLVEHHRIDLGPFGRQGCVGAYAEVARAGRLRTGERLEVRRGPAAPRIVIDSAVTRLRDHRA